MADHLPDHVPVAELPERLGLSRARCYDLMGALGIQGRKVGRSAFVTGDQLAQLLRCRDALQQGLTLAQYVDQNPPELPIEPTAGLVADTSSPPTAEQLLAAVLALVQQQQALPAAPPAPDPVDALERRLRVLQQLADSGLVVPTSELAAVLGISGGALRGRGHRFLAYGLTVTREQQGRSVHWRVSR